MFDNCFINTFVKTDPIFAELKLKEQPIILTQEFFYLRDISTLLVGVVFKHIKYTRTVLHKNKFDVRFAL